MHDAKDLPGTSLEKLWAIINNSRSPSTDINWSPLSLVGLNEVSKLLGGLIVCKVRSPLRRSYIFFCSTTAPRTMYYDVQQYTSDVAKWLAIAGIEDVVSLPCNLL